MASYPPSGQMPRCFLCPVAATSCLTPVERKVCICLCDAVHTLRPFGFSKAESKWGYTSEWRHLNMKAVGDFLTYVECWTSSYDFCALFSNDVPQKKEVSVSVPLDNGRRP